ncbi:MAG: pyridine nucleotide-disulfide oxidoreductase, partial [Lachnospiraceae bacterium]|nr:pyridine nucleotide-disulfide oxidoreductase [Lachnospiraceae bacterium]
RTRGAIVTENFETNVPGIFAAGNVLHVHDLVDFVSLEAESLADAVAAFVKNGSLPDCGIEIRTDRSINHTVPMKVSGEEDFVLTLRVSRPMKNASVVIKQGGEEILKRKFTKALPAEMIRIPVKKEKLNGKGDLEVTAVC